MTVPPIFRSFVSKGACVMMMSSVAAYALTACGDLSPELPAGIVDPATYTTADAARRQARYAQYVFQLKHADFVEMTGLLTDELISGYYGSPRGQSGGTLPIDARDMGDAASSASGITLKAFGEVRRYTQQARHALAKYAPDHPPALRGEMYALEALTEVYMADALCAGVPLSTVDFEQDFTYTSPLSTREVYQHAVAMFDTAIVLGRDSAPVHYLARVGKARALLALGRYEDADTVVANVPNDFRYQLPNSGYQPEGLLFLFTDRASAATSEGQNGLPYRTVNPEEQDPRIPLFYECQSCNPLFIVRHYPFSQEWWTLASGVEARLTRAEAAVQRDDPAWLTTLNTVRTDGTYDVVLGPDDAPDTLWHAGTGGVAGLGPLEDPALAPLPPGKTAKDVRADLVFRERAYWLYLTGHRQGDLRRLVREYGRPQETVYPTGSYPGGVGQYGRDVNFAIEQDERYNPHFLRCSGRGA